MKDKSKNKKRTSAGSVTKHKRKTLKKRLNMVILLMAALGGFLSLYLWNVHLTGSDVLCATGGCDDILKGEYSEIAGVPVAAMGFAFYTAIIVLAFQRSKITHRLLDNMMALLIGVGVIFTIYLRYLEFAKIGDICSWCWGSVVIIAIMLIAIIIERVKTVK